jgi:hypothetical protein
MYKYLKPLHPGGIRTRDKGSFLFLIAVNPDTDRVSILKLILYVSN